jgi:hypothetical protein
MSTRSRIGIQLDNSIVSVYHHWDGYPEGVGKTLNQHFTTKEQVTELIDGGDLSTIMPVHDWDGNKVETPFPLYYSERGDQNVEPRMDESLEDYLSDGEEYAYLFDNGTWICYDLHGKKPKKVKIPM